MSKLLKTIVLAVAIISSFVLAVPSAHAGKSCAKRGYKTVERTGGGVLMGRDIPSNRYWSDDARRYYVCSLQYGRRVSIGEYGISWDGEVFFSDFSIYGDTVAYSTGTSGNAGGGSTDAVTLVNLKTGKKRRFSVDNSDSEAFVGAIAQDGNGAIAWTEAGDNGGCEVHLSKRRDGTAHSVVASGPEVDCGFLRFGYKQIGGKQQLIWATKTANADAE